MCSSDLTMVRLWFFNKKAELFLGNIFKEGILFNNGTVIDDNIALKYRIPAQDNRYGDLIWWANPGVLISPDYFHPLTHTVKAMHGYDVFHDKSKGFGMIYSEALKTREINEANLIDMCPTFCNLMHIKYPAANEGIGIKFT